MRVISIRSGGQTGVDRAALDTARTVGIPICGWCPKGGWAEDYPDPPGVRSLYPELQETPMSDVAQRTVWNVRDSDATLIIDPSASACSAGTRLTERAAVCFHRPYKVVTGMGAIPEVKDWLNAFDRDIVLNIGGPRASECLEAYAIAASLLTEVL